MTHYNSVFFTHLIVHLSSCDLKRTPRVKTIVSGVIAEILFVLFFAYNGKYVMGGTKLEKKQNGHIISGVASQKVQGRKVCSIKYLKLFMIAQKAYDPMIAS